MWNNPRTAPRRPGGGHRRLRRGRTAGRQRWGVPTSTPNPLSRLGTVEPCNSPPLPPSPALLRLHQKSPFFPIKKQHGDPAGAGRGGGVRGGAKPRGGGGAGGGGGMGRRAAAPAQSASSSAPRNGCGRALGSACQSPGDCQRRREPPPAPATPRRPRPVPSFPPAGGRSRSPHKLVLNLAAVEGVRGGGGGVGGGGGKGLSSAGWGLAGAVPRLPSLPSAPAAGPGSGSSEAAPSPQPSGGRSQPRERSPPAGPSGAVGAASPPLSPCPGGGGGGRGRGWVSRAKLQPLSAAPLL